MTEPSKAAMQEARKLLERIVRKPYELHVITVAAALDRHAAEGWKEAAIAWAVCRSLHREYAKGKDPFFKTRQADFEKSENEARAAAIRSAP